MANRRGKRVKLHHYTVQVYYEDTDMGGIVYHANYLRYIERARSDWVRQIGLDQNDMRDGGIVFVVRKIAAEFIATARFEDRLSIETTVEDVSGVRLTMHQTVRRGEQIIFTAEVLAVCMNAAGRPVRLPAEIRALA